MKMMEFDELIEFVKSMKIDENDGICEIDEDTRKLWNW